VNVFGRISLVGIFNRGQLANRAIYGLVGQVLGCGTAAAVEESYQTSANGFVFTPRSFAVGVQPIEKAIKRFSG
jgi:hypothetical protein